MSLIFAVPLLVEDIAPAVREAIHRKVFAYLSSERAKRAIAPSPEESVSTSYYSPEASILADAALDELQQFVIDAAKAFLEKGLRLPPRRLEIERAWINVFEPGAQEAQHTHDGSLLSCSYYVEAPKDCGCLVLPDPIASRRTHREFTRTAGRDLLTRSEIAVEPQPGRLIMFESWMPHYVQCNKSAEVRISIAMNLREVSPRVPIPQISSPPASSQTPSSQTPSSQPASSQPASSQPASSQPARGDDVHASEPEPQRTNAARAAAAPFASGSDGKPFLFDHLFEVCPGFKLSLEPIQNAIPTVVIDDFLKRPEEARDVVGRAPAANWKHEKGGRNFVDYYDCRLRFPVREPNGMIAAAQQVIRKVYTVDTRPADACVDVNWFMQIHEKRADFAVPHNDMTKVRRSFTCIVYLNRREECSGGTAFFRFKRSGSLVLDDAYVRAIQQDSRLAETGLDYWPSGADEAWEHVGSIEMVPGRLLIFPSEYFHAAWHPRNSFYEFPRLTLAFWMVS